MKLQSYSEKDTYEIGRSLGEKTAEGSVVSLTGDLGVGKTVFTAGFAKGLGITEPICSPTFTIVQVYEEGRIPLYHFDVYRIDDPDEMYEIGFDEYAYGNLPGIRFTRTGTIATGNKRCDFKMELM